MHPVVTNQVSKTIELTIVIYCNILSNRTTIQPAVTIQNLVQLRCLICLSMLQQGPQFM